MNKGNFLVSTPINTTIEVPGLFLLPNALPPELYEKIKLSINSPQTQFHLQPIIYNRTKNRHQNARKVIMYGYAYNYQTKNIYDRAPAFPNWLRYLLEFCVTRVGLLPSEAGYYNQCIINRYLPGEGIADHTDLGLYGDKILVFSLGSGILMNFKRTINGVIKTVPIYIPENSIYIMSGEARIIWTHGIVGRKSDIDPITKNKIPRRERWSITFRHVPANK